MSRRKQVERLDAFNPGEGDLAQVADEIFGASEGPTLDTGRIVARPISLAEIYADVQQPRRAIPASIRLWWMGAPEEVPGLIEEWRVIAERKIEREIDIQSIITGSGDGIDTDGMHILALDFIELARLAANIKAVGLTNPISVANTGAGWRIVAGERRYLAYHMLRMWLGDEWAKIPCIEGSAANAVWRQASENTQRKQLNAIGNARQLALLIMAARTETEGVIYRAYENIVQVGRCDRVFYAQVADGNTHRIPRGSGEKIQQAMNLSKTQLSRYRTLLRPTQDERINDILWLRADVEDWPEGVIRDAYTLPIGNLSALVERENWTLDDLRDMIAQSKPEPHTVTGVTVSPEPARPAAPQGAPATSPAPVTAAASMQLYREWSKRKGDAVQVIMTDETGRVENVIVVGDPPRCKVMVAINGEIRRTYAPHELYHYPMSWEAYVEEERRVDPGIRYQDEYEQQDATPDYRKPITGTVGRSTEQAASKQPSGDGPGLLRMQDLHVIRLMLGPLGTRGEGEACGVLNELVALTYKKAQEMSEEGTLREFTEYTYSAVYDALNRLLLDFQEALERIMSEVE